MRVMPVERGVTQSRWDCVNVRGFGALTVALALRLPGDYGTGVRGINQHGELAVVEQAQRAEQLTADRDRFPLYLRGGHNLAAKGGIEGRLSGRLVRPGRASTAFLSTYKSLRYRDNQMNV